MLKLYKTIYQLNVYIFILIVYLWMTVTWSKLVDTE
jgi:hypothetical protein